MTCEYCDVIENETGTRNCPIHNLTDHVNGFDYKNQAWVVDGRYVRCGHPLRPPCGCYGAAHEGEPVAADADIFLS